MINHSDTFPSYNVTINKWWDSPSCNNGLIDSTLPIVPPLHSIITVTKLRPIEIKRSVLFLWKGEQKETMKYDW